LACVSKSVPRDVTSSIGSSTQLLRSTVGVSDARESGLIAQHPFLVGILIFRVPEAFAHDDASERSMLEETLEGTLVGLLKQRDK
jgi:hypothetical protein